MLQGKNNREGELKCLLHTALISTILMKKGYKKIVISKSVRSERWKIHYLLKLEAHWFCFWLLNIRFLGKIKTKCSGLRRI